MTSPSTSAVTARPNIGYSLVFRIASGAMFVWPDQPIALSLIEIPNAHSPRPVEGVSCSCNELVRIFPFWKAIQPDGRTSDEDFAM